MDVRRVHTGDTSDEIASQPSKVCGPSVRMYGRSEGNGGTVSGDPSQYGEQALDVDDCL